MKFASFRRHWRLGLMVVASTAAVALGAVQFACATQCPSPITIEDGEYSADADEGDVFAGSVLSVEGEVVTVEYRDAGVTYLVELRPAPLI